MAAIRIPIGMTDLVILFGTKKAAEKATRRILSDGKPAPLAIHKKGFGE